jgi:septum formation inhibitor-activating ATPase MinD
MDKMENFKNGTDWNALKTACIQELVSMGGDEMAAAQNVDRLIGMLSAKPVFNYHPFETKKDMIVSRAWRSMNQKPVSLSESDLHKMIKDAVMKVIKESKK